jgi:hypothetical protein
MEGYKNKTLANVIRNNAIKFPYKNIEGYLIKQHKKCSDERKSKKKIINGCLKRTLVNIKKKAMISWKKIRISMVPNKKISNYFLVN